MRKILELIYSPIFVKNCSVCKQIVSENYALCFDCWGKLQFVAEPKCSRCSIVFPTSGHLQSDCECVSRRFLFDLAQSVVKYNETASKICHQLKASPNYYLSNLVAKLVAFNCQQHLNWADYICPVPFFSEKLKKQGFNPCALILKKMPGYKGKIIFDLMSKTRNTKQQRTLNQKNRLTNLQNAFAVTQKYKSTLVNKNVVIFDDVITTGTTVNECTKPLLEAGAKSVRVVSFARATLSD